MDHTLINANRLLEKLGAHSNAGDAAGGTTQSGGSVSGVSSGMPMSTTARSSSSDYTGNAFPNYVDTPSQVLSQKKRGTESPYTTDSLVAKSRDQPDSSRTERSEPQTERSSGSTRTYQGHRLAKPPLTSDGGVTMSDSDQQTPSEDRPRTETTQSVQVRNRRRKGVTVVHAKNIYIKCKNRGDLPIYGFNPTDAQIKVGNWMRLPDDYCRQCKTCEEFRRRGFARQDRSSSRSSSIGKPSMTEPSTRRTESPILRTARCYSQTGLVVQDLSKGGRQAPRARSPDLHTARCPSDRFLRGGCTDSIQEKRNRSPDVHTARCPSRRTPTRGADKPTINVARSPELRTARCPSRRSPSRTDRDAKRVPSPELHTAGYPSLVQLLPKSQRSDPRLRSPKSGRPKFSSVSWQPGSEVRTVPSTSRRSMPDPSDSRISRDRPAGQSTNNLIKFNATVNLKSEGTDRVDRLTVQAEILNKSITRLTLNGRQCRVP